MTNQAPRYITRPYAKGTDVRYYVFDKKTDSYIGIPYLEEYLAQEKCNELNRLKSPH